PNKNARIARAFLFLSSLFLPSLISRLLPYLFLQSEITAHPAASLPPAFAPCCPTGHSARAPVRVSAWVSVRVQACAPAYVPTCAMPPARHSDIRNDRDCRYSGPAP